MKHILTLLCLSCLVASLAGCGARRANSAELPTNNTPPPLPPIQSAPAQELKVPPQDKQAPPNK
jgi:hypothetical protein